MDNTQLSAPDGAWFLFADWQGMTRIALPGDKVKTDANLDRPYQDKPLVLRRSGQVWSEYAVDIDPVSLKKSRPAVPGHGSPDPLGGPDIEVGYSGETVSIRGASLPLTASGEEVRLGGRDGRRERFGGRAYDVFSDGAVVVFGHVEKRTQAALVLREDDAAGRVAWCRHIARLPNGAPDAFRDAGRTFLADRDRVEGVAYLVEIRDDGNVASELCAPAVAGPWVLDGQVWWQPDDATLCAGPRLGEVAERFTLVADHEGPGRLLRLSGRKLFLPWHGVALLDLAPAKKGKGEISRKHKATDEPMYRGAERLLRPIAAGMARRGVRVAWRGCTRSGKRIEPQAVIDGRADIVTYLAGFAIQDGAPARLAGVGVTSVGYSGGGSFDDILAAPAATTADDVRDLVAMLDAAGISRAAGIPHLHTLDRIAAERSLALPLTPDAADLALAAVLSGLRLETSGPVPPATADAFAKVAPILGDYDACRKAGINSTTAALFITIAGHRRFGAEAVEPTRKALVAMNPTYGDEVAKALGQPFVPYVAPTVEEPALDAGEAKLIADLEAALTGLGLDPATSREGLRWYRFSIDDAPFQAGLHDDFRVQATLCATETDADLSAIAKSLAAANKHVRGAQFLESDCYLHVRAACPFAQVSAEKVGAMVRACRDAIASDAGAKLRAKYRTFE